jgi:hypothetical protein
MVTYLSKLSLSSENSQVVELLSRISMAMLMSFCARGLSSIPGDYFCYIAISSAAIVGILPGYLVRTCILSLYADLF